MKENIKEDINLENFKLLISDCKEHRKLYNESFISGYDIEIMDNILSDYKRVLKENEELKYKYGKALSDLVNTEKGTISKQKIQDKIEELNEYYKKEIYPECFHWADVDITEYYDGMIDVLQDLLEEKGE